MATGERIRFFRTLRGMTQKYLGMLLGFPPSSADVRMAQYESEDRTPKADLTAQMAEALDVSPRAIAVPDIDSMDGLMHTLFALEDRRLIRILDADGAARQPTSNSACGPGRSSPPDAARERSRRRSMTAGAIVTRNSTTPASAPRFRRKLTLPGSVAGSPGRRIDRHIHKDTEKPSVCGRFPPQRRAF